MVLPVTITMNLGEPYEKIIEDIIREGHAGSKTEVVRQALKAYKRQLQAEKKEEARLVKKKVDKAMADIRSGKAKTYPWEEAKKELGLK